ncbi:MAG: hypothetical protein KBT18_14175 [Comamonas sp.]|nr:hypothetical protein [Candidatus Comamonas equi]
MRMKHWFTLTAIAGLVCTNAMAQEQARVLSAIPVMQQVGIPQQFCEDAQVAAGPRTNGTGAVIGAIIGGIAGNALGQGAHRGPRGHYYGSTRGPSTVVGALAGGVIGNVIEGSNRQGGYETVRRCTNETVYENQTVGYDVTYEYAGRRYTTRLDYDPGQWMPIQVQPQGNYGSTGSSAGRFVGPSGVYQSAPANMVVTESITYTPASPPTYVGVDAGYPPPPMHGPRPAPYWR